MLWVCVCDNTAMIRINLLPQEFRPKETVSYTGRYFKTAILAGVALTLLTLVFYVDFILSFGKLRRIEGDWKTSQPEYQKLTQLQKEVEGPLKQERQFMEQFVTTSRPLTSFLMWGSELLPDSAWLVELKLSRSKESGNFLIKGLSLPSKEKTSIEHIESFLQALKAKMPDTRLALTTTRQEIDKVELTQFTAHFGWGAEDSKTP